MNERKLQALALHERGLSYADVGREMGISRQTAYEHVQKARAFSAQQQPSRDLQSQIYGPAEPMGGYDVPFTVPARYAVDFTHQGGWTPSRLAGVITSALQLMDTATLFSLYREVEQKDANYRTAKENRTNQLLELLDHVKPASDRLRDRKVAEWVEENIVAKDAFQAGKEALFEARFDGVAACEKVWGTDIDGDICLTALEPIPARHLVISKLDGRTLYLAPAVPGGAPVPLDPRKVAIHYGRKSGLALAGGLALVAVWGFVLKWLALRDWASLSALWGKPVKLGKYAPGTNAADIQKMRSALSQLGSEAAALVPNTMTIEFLKDASVSGSATVAHDLVRYLDEQVSKLIEGSTLASGTSNTGGGGSMALGKVHAGNGISIMRADAKLLRRPLQEVIKDAVELQFGVGTPVPHYSLLVEETEDITALAGVAKELAGIGVPLSKKKLAERVGLELADPNEPDDAVSIPSQDRISQQDQGGAVPDTEGGGQAVPADKPVKGKKGKGFTASSQGQASFAAGNDRDAIDGLVDAAADDWEQVNADIDAALTEITRNSAGLDDLRKKLASFAESGDVEKLRLYLTEQRTKARLAGSVGAQL